MKTTIFCLRPLFLFVVVAFFCQTVFGIDIVWTNTAGGNWSAATNWNPHQVPTVSDNAYITNNGTYTVTLDIPATNAILTLGGTSGTQTFSLVGSQFTINGPSSVGSNGVLNLAAGSLVGSGDLSVSGHFYWSSGNHSGTGLTTITTNASLVLTNNASYQLIGRTILNQGSIFFSKGSLLLQSGGTISNATGATFDMAADISISGTTAELFANNGLFRKTAGTNQGLISARFNNSGTLQVQSGLLELRTGVTNTGTISVSSGAAVSLTANSTLMAGNTVLSGSGTVLAQGGGTVVFTNNYLITNVTLNLGGDFVNFNSDAILWPAVVNLSGGALGGTGNLTINAPINWTAGNISNSATVTVTGGLTVGGTGHDQLQNGTLINTGSAIYSSGFFDLQSGATFSNAPGATFDITFDGNITGSSSSPTTLFANAGTLRKTVGTNLSTISGLFANSSLVQIQAATLSLTGQGTNTGAFSVSSGATLNLAPSTGTLLMADGSTISGAGNFSVGGGIVNLNGTLGVGGTSIFSGGTANFNGSYNITGGAATITSGTANFNGAGTISPSVLNLGGGTLGGTNNVTVNGFIYWTGTTITGSGAIIANGGLILGYSGHMQLQGRNLINTASAAFTNGFFDLQSGATFSNAPGATFDITFDGNISGSAATPIANAGLFRKTGGSANSTISPAFNNSGSVDVQTGTMTLNAGGTNTGSFVAESGATLALSGGTHNFNPGSAISGAGTFNVNGATANLAGSLNVTGTNSFSGGTANFSGNYIISGGTLNISGCTVNFNGNGNITPAILNLSNGTLGGTNNVAVSAPFIWAGGNISGSGAVIAGGGLYLTNNTARSLTGRSLINLAQALWNSGAFSTGTGSVISNASGATFDLGADVFTSNLSGSRNWYNAGLLRKVGGTGTSTISDNFTNTGTLEVQTGTVSFTSASTQTAGQIFLNGGNLTCGVNLQLLGGTLTGSGMITGTVTNSATVNPGNPTGQLIFNGAYTQTATGILNLDLAGTSPGTTFDKLIVSNTPTFAGTLNVNLTNGYYPAPGTIFAFLTNTTTRSGTFNSFTFQSNLVGMQLNYGANTSAVQIINVLPVIPAIANQTNDELVNLSFNINATDSDTPVQTLTYSLTNSPANATISSSGVFSWTPTEAQGPGTSNITVVVTDNGSPNLTTTQSFQVVVREINTAPMLSLPLTQTINELTLLNVFAIGSDTDIPLNPLTYALVSGPTGLTVDSNSGAISWVPNENQGPSTNLITISVTDTNPVAANVTSLSTTNSFTVIVNEVNTAPVLIMPTNQTLMELTTLNTSVSATDSDYPANNWTFSLLSPPGGMTIDTNTGAITWTPSEAQGPSTNVISVVVTDFNPWAVNSQHLSTTNTFVVTVNESNQPPVLTLPVNSSFNELTTYSNNATATDPDIPANPLTFALVSGPTNLTVSASGVILWTPTEPQGPSTNLISISVTDTNQYAVNAKSISVTNSFQLIVNESNQSPVLNLPVNSSFNELTTYSNNATAIDPDIPANSLTFALVSGPTNLTVSSAGVILWTPTEAQGPSTNLIFVSVTDTNQFALNAKSISVTNSFQLIVNEVNTAPVVGSLTNQTANAGQTVTLTAIATDADLPTNTLTFSLVNPPAGASIVAGSGLFSWRLPASLAKSTNTVRIKVTDNGSPNLSATNSFTVTINPLSPVTLTPLSYSNGLFRMQVSGEAGPDYILQGSTNLTTFTDLATNTPSSLPFNFTNTMSLSNRFYRIRLNP